MAKVILIALGDNAIKLPEEKGSSEEQFKNCRKTALEGIFLPEV